MSKILSFQLSLLCKTVSETAIVNKQGHRRDKAFEMGFLLF